MILIGKHMQTPFFLFHWNAHTHTHTLSHRPEWHTGGHRNICWGRWLEITNIILMNASVILFTPPFLFVWLFPLFTLSIHASLFLPCIRLAVSHYLPVPPYSVFVCLLMLHFFSLSGKSFPFFISCFSSGTPPPSTTQHSLSLFFL